MSTEIRAKIDEVFLETVESLTFMFGDPVDRHDVAIEQYEWSCTRLDFEGDRSGYLALTLPTEACPEIAANILGWEQAEVAAGVLGGDALKEMLNVISGHIVPNLQGDKGDFVLSIPTLESLDEAACTTLRDDEGTACYDLDGHPVMLTLKLDG